MRKNLSNPNATAEALQVYKYICDMQGKGILSGQQEDPRVYRHGNELRYIKAVTGKLPAIRGLDYIHNDFEGVNRRAKEWWKKGGIVTICWHWGTPPDGIGYPSSQGTIDVWEALTEGTQLNQGMLRQIDEVAEALTVLRDAKVPVLWRPLHEFDGKWFWWGKSGPEAFKKLWILIYERFTKIYKLDNLIWVLGYCGDVYDGWYPGDEYVDIVGGDRYAEGIHEDMYKKVKSIVGDKFPICYHENGPLPDPKLLKENKVWWSWFMTWHTIHIREQNSKEYLTQVYSDDYVITLERLPRFI